MPKKFTDTFARCKGMCDDCETVADMLAKVEAFAAWLREVRADGGELTRAVEDDYIDIRVKNADPAVLKKYATETL